MVREMYYSMDAVSFARCRLALVLDEKQRVVLQSAKQFLVLNCSRQWGKSTLAAVKAVHRAYYRPGSTVVITSPGNRQSGECVKKAKTFVRQLGIPVKGDGLNPQSILLPNGSRIVGLPCEEGTIRGFSAVSLLIIDEAALVPDDVYLAVRPMTATCGGEVMLMSTPRGKHGFFYRAWTEGGPEWLKVAATAAECPRIPAKWLEIERSEMGEDIFRREYCCEFTDDEDGLFKEEWLVKAQQNGLEPLWGGR